MPERLPLVGRGPITFSSACHKNSNIINELGYVAAAEKLNEELWNKRAAIEALVRRHLGLGSKDNCDVADPDEWIQGSFNLCVLVEITSGEKNYSVVFRTPQAHRLTGLIDEKISTEVGTYVWMQNKCADVRIPHLYGFGFSDGRHFTHVSHRGFFVRFGHFLRRIWHSLFRSTLLSRYTANRTDTSISSAYLLQEYITPEIGQMLSNTWEEHREDSVKRQNLFKGIAQTILSLAKIPQPKIGSFKFHDDGTVTLSNRYLTTSLALLENDGAPRTIQPDTLYSSTDRFVNDLFNFLDTRLRAQPNATFGESDCRGQMAALTLLRGISHRFTRPEYRDGPFLLQLADFNPSNFFVDDEWNLKAIVDLEFVSALPAEMLNAPYWLAGHNIEGIIDEEEVAYDEVRKEFVNILETESEQASLEHEIPVAKVMEETWKSKGSWFWHSLLTVDAMRFLLEDHLCPQETMDDNIHKAVSEFWCNDASDFVRRKLIEKAKYDKVLKTRFA